MIRQTVSCVLNVLTLACAAASAAPALAEPISQADLLRRLINLDRLYMPAPAGQRSGLFSSIDPASREAKNAKQPQWAAAKDSGNFVRKTPDGWDVWCDAKGPGVATRLWCDSLAGDFQLVIDGKPVMSGKLRDLFTGTIEPLGDPLTYIVGERDGGGAGVCYFPFGFNVSCVIQTRGFSGAYQVDYTTFAAGTKVEPYSGKLDKAGEEALDLVAGRLRNGFVEKNLVRGKTMTLGNRESIGPGEKLELSLEKEGIVRALYVSLTDKTEPRDFYALHNMVLRAWWSKDSKTPDIEAPLIGFFGSGFERNLFNALVMGTNFMADIPGENPNESWFLYCFFPMPHKADARFEIENLNASKKKIGIMIYARDEVATLPPETLVFRSRFSREDPCKSFDFELANVAGTGRYVGTALSIDTPRGDWWGEGDHKAWVDGESFPSIWGTDTAGYFGNLRGLKRERRALAGVPAISPHGKNTLYRWHLADSIPFAKSLRIAIENQQANDAKDVSYSAVSYWYATAGSNVDGRGLKAADLKLHGLRIPGAVEIEGNIEGTGWGSTIKERDAGDELSGGAGVTITSTEPVAAKVVMKAAGTYELQLRVVPGRSFDAIEVTDDAGKPIGTVNWARTPDHVFPVGEVTLAAGENRLKVRCAKKASLDCWILKPVSGR